MARLTPEERVWLSRRYADALAWTRSRAGRWGVGLNEDALLLDLAERDADLPADWRTMR